MSPPRQWNWLFYALDSHYHACTRSACKFETTTDISARQLVVSKSKWQNRSWGMYHLTSKRKIDFFYMCILCLHNSLSIVENENNQGIMATKTSVPPTCKDFWGPVINRCIIFGFDNLWRNHQKNHWIPSRSCVILSFIQTYWRCCHKKDSLKNKDNYVTMYWM